jgi:hypothetical protein
MKFCLFLLLIIFSAQLHAQPRELNLQTQWQVYQNGSYVPFANQTTQSVHLELSSKTHTGTLYIADRHEFSVLVNGKLAWRLADTLKINWIVCFGWQGAQRD